MKRKNFYLTDPHIEYLDDKSKELDITVSEIIRRILEKHINEEKENKKKR